MSSNILQNSKAVSGVLYSENTLLKFNARPLLPVFVSWLCVEGTRTSYPLGHSSTAALPVRHQSGRTMNLIRRTALVLSVMCALDGAVKTAIGWTRAEGDKNFKEERTTATPIRHANGFADLDDGVPTLPNSEELCQTLPVDARWSGCPSVRTLAELHSLMDSAGVDSYNTCNRLMEEIALAMTGISSPVNGDALIFLQRMREGNASNDFPSLSTLVDFFNSSFQSILEKSQDILLRTEDCLCEKEYRNDSFTQPRLSKDDSACIRFLQMRSKFGNEKVPGGICSGKTDGILWPNSSNTLLYDLMSCASAKLKQARRFHDRNFFTLVDNNGTDSDRSSTVIDMVDERCILNTSDTEQSISVCCLVKQKRLAFDQTLETLTKKICLVQTLSNLNAVQSFIGRSGSFLRRLAFGHQNPTQSRQAYQVSARKLICHSAIEEGALENITGSDTKDPETEDVVATTTFLSSWWSSPCHEFQLMKNITSRFSFMKKDAVLTIAVDQDRKVSVKAEGGPRNLSIRENQLCIHRTCDYPFKYTNSASHSPLEKLKDKVISTLVATAPRWIGLARHMKSTPPYCGLVCKDILVKDIHTSQANNLRKVIGYPTLVLSCALILFLSLCRKRQKMPPLRLTLYTNISVIPLLILLLITTDTPLFAKVACFGDNVARFDESTSVNLCTAFAFAFVFFWNLTNGLLVLVAYKWYVLAKKLTGKGTNVSEGTFTCPEALILFFSIALSFMMAYLSLSPKVVVTVMGPCLPKPQQALWFIAVPFGATSLVCLSALLFGVVKLVPRMRESKSFRKSWSIRSILIRPSVSSDQSSVSVQSNAASAEPETRSNLPRRTRRKKNAVVLMRLIKTLLANSAGILLLGTLLTIVIGFQVKGMDRKFEQLKQLFLCRVMSCRASACPPIPFFLPHYSFVGMAAFSVGALSTSIPLLYLYRKVYLAEVKSVYRKLKTRLSREV